MVKGNYSDLIEAVRRQCDILDIVGDYVSLKKAGSNYKALCPFHKEKTPSFTVSPEKGVFYCFGCGAGGDAIQFLRNYEKIDFMDAVKRIAVRYGIEIEARERSGEKVASLREKLLLANADAAHYFHKLLIDSDEAQAARSYLKGRGVKPQTIDKFNIGFAGRAWEGLLREMEGKGYDAALLAQAGLIKVREDGKGYYDRFRERIIFPIYDLTGGVLGFGGRIYSQGNGDRPKYLNSPETELYRKSKSLYGLNLAKDSIRRNGFSIIVEGYLDLVSLHQAGVENVVATLGTALTADHAYLIARFAQKVIIAYDSDAAGKSAMARGEDIFLESGLKVKVALLPPGHDPDTFARAFGCEGLQKLIDGARPYVEYLIERAVERHGTAVPEAKSQAVDESLQAIGKLSNQVERFEYLRLLAYKVDLPVALLSRQLAAAKPKSAPPKAPQESTPQQAGTPWVAEKILLQLMISDGMAAKYLAENLSTEDFRDRNCKELYRAALDSIAQTGTADPKRMMELVPGDEQRDLIARLALEPTEDFDLNKALADCVNYLKRNRLKEKIGQTEKRIRDAEKGGRQDELKLLLSELSELWRGMN